MYWKITLDPAHTYAVEPGTIRSRYAQDFHAAANSTEGTFQCPLTGLIMLEPSFKKRTFGDDFKDLDNFRHKTENATFWRAISKSLDGVQMFSSLRPTGQPKWLDALDVAAGIAVINASDTFFDNLEWALESKFALGIDEAFAIHYRGLTDEILRKNNWLFVQWDNIGVHFSHQGHVTILQYADRGDLEGDRVVTHEFDIAQAGELLGKSGQFVFLPIPGYGLALYHLLGAANFGNIATIARNYSVRGAHLIPWKERLIGNHTRLFDTSLVRMALNPFHSNILGFQNITFTTEGEYLEQPFDPGYKPSLAPNDVSAQALNNFGGQFGTATATLRNNNDSGNWTAGTDRQGRVRFHLATSDTRYTPFVYGWGAGWERVAPTRNPGEVEITTNYESGTTFTSDVLQRLEWTDDSEGHFEGSCVLKIQSRAASIIMERGHCVYQIECSDDNDTWTVVNGGIAKFNKPRMEYHPSWGFFWQVKADLHGQHERFEELPHNLGTAFDGVVIGACINLCLRTSGFAPIADANMPAALLNIRVPALQEGTGFRFHPRFGDKMNRILRLLLFMARTQNNEYKMVYDWVNEVWTVVRRPKNLGFEGEEPEWTITYDESLEDLDNNVAYYIDPMEFDFQPVEATSFTVVGVAETISRPGEGLFDGAVSGPKIFESTPIRNESAVSDPGTLADPNMDYTGREMGVRILATGIASVEDANRIARQINPRFFHRNVLATVMLPPGHFRMRLAPDVKINLKLPPYFEQHGTDDANYDMWVKKRTVVVEGEEHGAAEGIANERTILQLESLWENPLAIEGGK